MKCQIIIIGISLFCFNLGLAQEKSQLEQEKQKLMDEIQKTSNVLQQTDKKIESNLENYNLLESQISNRKKLIANIENGISGTTSALEELDMNIAELKASIADLQLEYRNVLQQSYIYKLGQSNFLNFFSSKSFEDAYKKWVFSRQYRQFLSTKKSELQIKNLKLDSIYLDFKSEEVMQKTLLENKLIEKEKLNTSLVKKDRLLAKLEKQQANLKIELLAKKKRQRLIGEEIERIIKAELAKAKEAKPVNIEANNALSGSFSSNRGKFDRPINGAVISGRYGEQAHPTDPSLKIINNGIDFKANSSVQVSAIFEGVVVGDTFIPGVGNMLILRHGNYYSVYSRLDKLFVKRGDQVNTGQAIGEIEDVLHFEIWNGKDKQNPELWLK